MVFKCLNCNASLPSLTSCCPARDPNEECCPSLGDCLPDDQDEEVFYLKIKYDST